MTPTHTEHKADQNIATLEVKAYNLSDERHQNELNNIIRKLLHNSISTLETPRVTILVDEIDLEAYRKYNSYYIHYNMINALVNTLEITVGKACQLIMRCGVAELRRFEIIRNETADQTYASFIYAECKNNSYIDGTVDETRHRFDQFQTSFERSKKHKTLFIRQQGTRVGANARSSTKRFEFKEINRTFKRLLANGPGGIDKPVCDVDSGRVIENIKAFGIQTDKDDIHIHHAIFQGGKSSLKSGVEPSIMLSVTSYVNLKHEQCEELLGCILLSSSSHDMLHKMWGEDDIIGWLNREINGSLPYHWVSESNYNETLDWLQENVRQFEKTNALTYNQFKESMTIKV